MISVSIEPGNPTRRGVLGHRGGDARALRAQAARGEPGERAREAVEAHRVGAHPAAVDGLGDAGAVHAGGLEDRVVHRLLQRVAGVEVALERPALADAQGEPQRVLARAVVVDAVRAALERGGGARVAGEQRAAAERALADPAGEQDLGDAREVLAVAAVRRARDREVARRELEALEDAGADGGQGLERLGRRAQEDGTDVASAADGAVRFAQSPGEAMHALDVAAAPDAHGAGGGQQTTVSPPGRTSKTASAGSPTQSPSTWSGIGRPSADTQRAAVWPCQAKTPRCLATRSAPRTAGP